MMGISKTSQIASSLRLFVCFTVIYFVKVSLKFLNL